MPARLDAPQTTDKTLAITTASQDSYATGSNAHISSMRDSQSNGSASKSLPKVEFFDSTQTAKTDSPVPAVQGTGKSGNPGDSAAAAAAPVASSKDQTAPAGQNGASEWQTVQIPELKGDPSVNPEGVGGGFPPFVKALPDTAPPQPFQLNNNKTALSNDEVKQEAAKLDPMIKQFMTSNDYGTQKTDITNIQNELKVLIPHGLTSTKKVFDQVANDMKNDPSINADIGSNYMTDPTTASLGIINHKVTPGLAENGVTGIGIYYSPDSLSTLGNDGSAQLQEISPVKNGVVGTPKNTFTPIPAAPKRVQSYAGGGNDSKPAPVAQGVPQSGMQVQLRGAGGESLGTAEEYPGGIYMSNGDNPNPN